MAHDVFYLHNRVVHQHADHQRQRQQSHHVDGKAQVSHANEGRDDRQRQRHRRDKGGPPIAQEQPDHQHRQNRALVQQQQRAVVFLFHRGHKVKGFGDLDVRVLQTVVGQRLAHQTAHGHLALALAAHHFKTHHGLAIQCGSRPRIGQGVAHRAHLVQAHAAAPRCGQLNLSDFLRRLDGGQRANGLFTHAQRHASARAFLLHLLELARHFGRRDAQRLQAVHIQSHTHFSCHATHAVDGTHTTQRQKLARDLFVDQPRQRFVVHARRTHGVGQHGGARQVELLHHRVAQVTGQIGPHALNGRAHIVHRLLTGFFHAELGGDRHHAVLHLGGDVFEAL